MRQYDGSTTLRLKPAKPNPLTKSKFVHGMQCPLYVWLEVRTDTSRPEADAFTQALFDAGNEVGEYARRRWDRRLAAMGRPPGVRVTDKPELHAQAVAETQAALAAGADVIHEAAFTFGGVRVRVDVLERLADGSFAVNEVKSTSTYEAKKHLLDAAVQLWVVRGAGLDVSLVRIVHMNNRYEWPGGEYDLEKLFADEDVTEAAEAAQDAIAFDVARLLRVLEHDDAPVVPEGTKCRSPYGCPYEGCCPALGEPVDHPVSELPGRSDAVAARCEAEGFLSLLDMDEPAARRNLVYANGKPHDGWYYTWKATATGERIVLPACDAWLGDLVYPLHHLDFETITSPLPMIPYTHPFDQVTLQYSLHIEHEDGTIEHREFLADAADPDPRRSLIEQMLTDLGGSGTVLGWSSFEKTRVTELAANPRYEAYRDRLRLVAGRLKDVGMAVNKYVFDEGFHGRWSVKIVYPTLVPGVDPDEIHDEDEPLSYDDLDGVAKGNEAAMILLEYVRPETTSERRAEIRRQMLQYCRLDTWAMVRILSVVRSECAAR